MAKVRRLFVEKKKEYNVAAKYLLSDLRQYLCIPNLLDVRIAVRYDIEGISNRDFDIAKSSIFSEPPIDHVYDEVMKKAADEYVFAIEFLPGQYDQRADSAAQSIQIISRGTIPILKTAQVIFLKGELTKADIHAIKEYLINPVDSREAALLKPDSLNENFSTPTQVDVIEGFITMTDEEAESLLGKYGLAMNIDDLLFCRKYFAEEEKRDPTLTEMMVLDTYWSDHCRHTTFLSRIDSVYFEPHSLTKPIEKAYQDYLDSLHFVYGDTNHSLCLMDIALMGMKEMKKKGQLADIEVSDEINACSIVVEAEMVDGTIEPWLVMFKNETHNHPTEIEPFGGAATCLGGAIRDPLSGRSYVYQAMRITGCGNPLASKKETLPGKLPQRKISLEAAQGYSSYGNQIGLATGFVTELYHEGYLAKRMEIGAVIAAAPRDNVKREKPIPGDCILLVGGRTGRDGCGGATGSSKSHTLDSILTCGAEVQKGNPPTERKIQRLFRNPEVSKCIKKCNDFGAGGVSVAIGELADGLHIDLDAVPKKYEGLDGTELAISESQERMAVLVDRNDVDRFIQYASEENIEATLVARVTDDSRIRIFWQSQCIVDLSRRFINTNGIMQHIDISVVAPDPNNTFFDRVIPGKESIQEDLESAWLANLKDLNVCSQKGMIEHFDSTIGAASVLHPFGGKFQNTPVESMVATLPVVGNETVTATIMSYGYMPDCALWSPFHGAAFAVVEAVAKIVALGGEYKKIRFTLQEYFEKLHKDPKRWGKPFAALLGAFQTLKQLGIPAIGGKDSMSGTFEDMSVPPALVAIAVCPTQIDRVISPEFKQPGNWVISLPLSRSSDSLPDFAQLKKQYDRVTELIHEKKIISVYTVRLGGIAAAISKMAFGNLIGVEFFPTPDPEFLFVNAIGSFVCEVKNGVNMEELFAGINYRILGKTTKDPVITFGTTTIALSKALDAWEGTLESLFATRTSDFQKDIPIETYPQRNTRKSKTSVAKPRVFIPVFPGTNCEYDSARVFENEGAEVSTVVFNNLTPQKINESLKEIVKVVDNSQIIMIPGGFSSGDEPDGSGKFIAAVFRNHEIMDAVGRLMEKRDGLMLGICNGFQAFIKLGLVPYGTISERDEHFPILTTNLIGRHVSRMISTKITSVLSPWFANVSVNDVHTIAVSHGEGRFVAEDSLLDSLFQNGQIATQYVDDNGRPTMASGFNPNGSVYAIEGITSPDGRILGKMAHSERIGEKVGINISGCKDQKLFSAGIAYFL